MTSNRKKVRQYNGRTTNRRVGVELSHLTSAGIDPTDVATVDTTHVTMRLFDAEGTNVLGETRRVFGAASFHNVTDLKVENVDLSTTNVVRLTFSTTNSNDDEVTGRYDVSLFGLSLSDLNDAVVAALLKQATVDA